MRSSDIELFGLPGRTSACVPVKIHRNYLVTVFVCVWILYKAKCYDNKNVWIIYLIDFIWSWKLKPSEWHLLDPDADGRLSTELAEHANAWSLILPRSPFSCELLKSLDTSLAPLNFLFVSLNFFNSFGELCISFGCLKQKTGRKEWKI